jgi:predicted ATPase with chaperone activity
MRHLAADDEYRHIEVARADPSLLQASSIQAESSADAARVAAARERQLERQGVCNAHLDHMGLSQHSVLDAEGRERWRVRPSVSHGRRALITASSSLLARSRICGVSLPSGP